MIWIQAVNDDISPFVLENDKELTAGPRLEFQKLGKQNDLKSSVAPTTTCAVTMARITYVTQFWVTIVIQIQYWK